MMPPKQAEMAMRGYPCRATVMSEKQSVKGIKKVLLQRRVLALTSARRKPWFTSDAVAPGQEREPQHGVAEAEHHAQHLQDSDHLGGGCADQHGAHNEAQRRKHLQEARKQSRTFNHCCAKS